MEYEKKYKNRKYILIVTSIMIAIFTVVFVLFIMQDTIKPKERPITKLADLSKLGKGSPVIMFPDSYTRWERGKLEELPKLNSKYDNFAIDLRSYDLSEFDLSHYKNELECAVFDTNTKWPAKLPVGFEPEKILELGKNPGLGIKTLHEQGITGKGVNIAVIDSMLFLDHDEYKKNIMLYELLNSLDDGGQMHGPGVTSLAVGKNTGVAPDAQVYYIALTFGNLSPVTEKDLGYVADGINRILEINKQLQKEEKIRVISISTALEKNDKNYNKAVESIEMAKKEGIFVITVSQQTNYNYYLTGLRRGLLEDPDHINSYDPGYYSYFIDVDSARLLMVPMDSRTNAYCTGSSDYMFASLGGPSWTCPWLSGMYALCVQVKPEITPDEFIKIAFKTGDIIRVPRNRGADLSGTIVNPIKMIEEIKKKL